jgi:hypothetical protein
MTAVTTTETRTVKLQPSTRARLLIKLKAAQKEKIARDIADQKYEKIKGEIRAIREATGEVSLEFDGYTISNVTGNTTKFDEKKMIAHGLSVEEIEGFKVTTPKKPYEKISFPAERVAKRLLGGHHGD